MLIEKIQKMKLPTAHIMDGKTCYWDPLRRKDVPATPEEKMRQQFIQYLITELDIPKRMIQVEMRLSLYPGNELNAHRADLVIEYLGTDNLLYPLAIVECKAPDVPCAEDVKNQLFTYCSEIGSYYAIFTNGYEVYIWRYDDDKKDFIPLDRLYTYKEMLNGQGAPLEFGPVPDRFPFDQLKEHCHDDEYLIGTSTSEYNAMIALNLAECFFDQSHPFPTGVYRHFTVKEDLGTRYLRCGNASGGIFEGSYRSLRIEFQKKIQIVSFAISSVGSYAKPDYSGTALNVALEKRSKPHHSLQLNLDRNMSALKDKCIFRHGGAIGIGRSGSGKREELRRFVADIAPELISGEGYLLGKLNFDRLWYMDDPEIVALIENLTTYALIRDLYRDAKKAALKQR